MMLILRCSTLPITQMHTRLQHAEALPLTTRHSSGEQVTGLVCCG